MKNYLSLCFAGDASKGGQEICTVFSNFEFSAVLGNVLWEYSSQRKYSVLLSFTVDLTTCKEQAFTPNSFFNFK